MPPSGIFVHFSLDLGIILAVLHEFLWELFFLAKSLKFHVFYSDMSFILFILIYTLYLHLNDIFVAKMYTHKNCYKIIQ